MEPNVRHKETASAGVYKLQRQKHFNETCPKTRFKNGLEKFHTVEMRGSDGVK